MSRGLDPANESASEHQEPKPVLFAEFDFSGGFVRFHSLLGTITWGGYDWTGTGLLGRVTGIEENSDLSKKTVTYELSGIPSEVIGIVLGEEYQGRTAKLYLGFLDQTTYQLVATPELISRQRMDVVDVAQGKECTVTLTAESRLAAWNRPQVRRMTHADQQTRFPGDKGFEFIDQAAQSEVVWGRKT